MLLYSTSLKHPTYDSSGKLIEASGGGFSLADGTGNMVYFSYDVRNRLEKVVGGRNDVLADYDDIETMGTKIWTKERIKQCL